MKKIYITDLIPEEVIEKLKNYFHVDVNRSGKDLSKEEMIDTLGQYDGIITMFTNTIDQEVIDALDSVKILANYAVGYNNIDAAYAKSKGIIVTNTPGVLSDTTAETAWALLFAVSRRIVEADKLLRSGGWGRFSYNFLSGQDVYKKTLGIIGAGRIGKKMAEKSKGFNMKLLYHNRSRDYEFEQAYDAEYVSLDRLLKEADIVSVHAPLTEETHHLLDYDKLSLMKHSGILINTARGPLVDEQALVRILKEEKIYGAGLDVFESEPFVSKELLTMDNVVLLPHIGSSSIETRTAMANLAADNIIDVLQGKTPISPV